MSLGPNGGPVDGDYESVYFYDSVGRLNRVTGPGPPAYGAVYSFVTDSDMSAGHTFNSDESTALGGVARTCEPTRDLIASVENTWGSAVVSKYAYLSDGIGRRTSVVNTGAAFDTLGAVGHDRYTYNARNELDRSQRFAGTDPYDPNPIPVTGRDYDYEYDPIGNRTTVSVDQGVPTSYTSNNLNQYTEVTPPGRPGARALHLR